MRIMVLLEREKARTISESREVITSIKRADNSGREKTIAFR